MLPSLLILPDSTFSSHKTNLVESIPIKTNMLTPKVSVATVKRLHVNAKIKYYNGI